MKEFTRTKQPSDGIKDEIDTMYETYKKDRHNDSF